MHGLWTNDPTRRGRRGPGAPATHEPAQRPRQPRGGRHREQRTPEACARAAPGHGTRADRVSPVSSPGAAVPAAAAGGGAGLARSSCSRCCAAATPSGPRSAGARAELALFMGDFGLSAAAARRRRLLLPRTPAAARSRFRPAWLLFALSSAMAVAGQRRLGLVRGRAPRARCRARQLADLFFLLLRPARHRRPAGARQAARHQGRLGLPGAGLLADRRLAAHAVLEPRARPRRALRRAERRPYRALARLPAAGHRPGQHGARAALPAFARQPLGGQHRDRRARPDRDVRRPVHLAPAAREHYHSGQLLDAGWFAGSLLLAYAPWVGGRAHAGAPTAAARPSRAVPASPAPIAGIAGARSRPTWPPPSARWASSTTSSTAAVSTAWCSSPPAPSSSPSSCARASCCSTTSPSPRSWPRRRTTSAPWCRAPATSS